MKKIIAMLLTLSTLFAAMPMAAGAQTNKIVGHVYTSDIVAYIDDMPIKSYNIGGQTVVSENELARYGFQVTWNGNARQLYIANGEKPQTAPSYTPDKRAPGKVIGNVYESDIKVYVNDTYFPEVPSYNIGGQTMIPLEALNVTGFNMYGYDNINTNREIGYSNYGFKVVWNGTNRTIKVDVLRKGCQVATQYGTFDVIGGITQYRSSSGTVSPGEGIYSDSTFVYPNDFLKIWLNIDCQWENGVLTINEPITKIPKIDGFAAGICRENALLALVEVPINVNGVKDTVHALINGGNVYLKLDDWNGYLFE